MESNLKQLGIRLVAGALALSIVLPLAYVPWGIVRNVPRAEAAGLPVWDIPANIERALNAIAMGIAQRIIDDMVKSTIRWANNGFDGNPAFVTDVRQHLNNVTSGVIGEYIGNSERFGFLCSPNQADQIRESLRQFYIKQGGLLDTSYGEYQCTLDELGVNFDSYQENFNNGGWSAWLALTQNDSSNPYGAYLEAKAEIDREISRAQAEENQEIEAGGGFIGYSECAVRNSPPPTSVRSQWQLGDAATRRNIEQQYPSWDPLRMEGDCLEQGPVKTPGPVIAAQLNTALGSGINKLIQADDWDALVSAFAGGLLQRYVFGRDGLISDSSTRTIVQEVIDIDGDRIPDGYDSRGAGPNGDQPDGNLDICHHGRRNDEAEPSNTNCLGSREAVSSPYFVPICESVSETSVALRLFQSYIDRTIADKPTYAAQIGLARFEQVANAWDPAAWRTWQNRTIAAQTTVDDFISTLSRFDVPQFDPVLNNFGAYSTHLDSIIESLITGKDMRNGGLPRDDNVTIHITAQANRERITYLETFTENLGQCDAPDTEAVGNIPLPPTDDLGGSTGEEDEDTP